MALTTAAHTFQSVRPAITCRLVTLSLFVTLPRPEPVSCSSLRTINSRSSVVRKDAVLGLSGSNDQMKNERKTVNMPSKMKILYVNFSSVVGWGRFLFRELKLTIASLPSLRLHPSSGCHMRVGPKMLRQVKLRRKRIPSEIGLHNVCTRR
jgi:hypothetical protein